MINYPDYFEELDFKIPFYNKENNTLNQEAILQAIETILANWRSKYPELKMKTDKLKFENLMVFNQSYTTEIEFLNLETK
jgi:hypothetical protein